METIQAVCDAINDFAPFETAMEWDNSGLLVGAPEEKVGKVGITLDVTDESLAEAQKKHCDCIVSHHPFLFSPVQKIYTSTAFGRRLKWILSGGISVIAAHTNWDVSPCGVNMILAEMLELENKAPLKESFDGAPRLWQGATGMLPSPFSTEEFALFAKESLSLQWIRVFGKKERVRKIALCGGSGGGYRESALTAGAELFLTSDMKYHEVQEAVDGGLSVALADHGEVERLSIPFLKKEIQRRVDIEVVELQQGCFDSGKTFV
ncbi:MAG: Nif3-like dinuclear metal center hexameric protein [Thermovirgaceae bacterium]